MPTSAAMNAEEQTLGAPPIFVFGALRSGTTLFRLMLESHAEVTNPGEADYLFDFLTRDETHPTGWRCDRAALAQDRIFRATGLEMPRGAEGSDLIRALVADLAARSPAHMTLNIHRNAAAMASVFPEAKIIHLVRDPRDVARSSVGMGWTGNSYFGIDHWIDTERGFDTADVPPAQVLVLSFETLMGNVETELRRVCAFIGVDFTDEMLSYHENTTYGPPDPSIAQQWKRRASAREIARLEGRLGPLLAARGYKAAGDPEEPGALEYAGLVLEHRFNRWRFNIRRYGFSLFMRHHLARLVGLRALARRLAAQKEAILVQSLK